MCIVKSYPLLPRVLVALTPRCTNTHNKCDKKLLKYNR